MRGPSSVAALLQWVRPGGTFCFEVLVRLLASEPIGRIVRPEAMRFGWQRLHAEYTK